MELTLSMFHCVHCINYHQCMMFALVYDVVSGYLIYMQYMNSGEATNNPFQAISPRKSTLEHLQYHGICLSSCFLLHIQQLGSCTTVSYYFCRGNLDVDACWCAGSGCPEPPASFSTLVYRLLSSVLSTSD